MKQGLEGDTGLRCNFDMIGSRLLTKIDFAAILRANSGRQGRDNAGFSGLRRALKTCVLPGVQHVRHGRSVHVIEL